MSDNKKYNVVNFDDFIRQGNPAPNSNNREIDVQSMLMQRLMTQQSGMGMGGFAPAASRVCTLTNNVPVYRKLNTGSFMEGAANLVVFSGNSTDLANKQVEVKGAKSCVLVENQTQCIDLSKVNESSANQPRITLIEVSVPFIGTILVPERCLVGFVQPQQPGNHNNRLLKG